MSPLGGSAVNTFAPPLTHWLNATATASRFGTVDQGGGQYTEGQSALGEICCRINPAGRQERVLAEQLSLNVTDVGYAAGDADVARGDEWTVNGATYRVTYLERPSIPTAYTKVLLERTEGARTGVTP